MGSTPSGRKLVINADDLGLSRGVTNGIVEAARAGVVTAASMMVNLPAFADTVHQLQQMPSLSVGLHFVLTTGRPISDSDSLRDSATGLFHSLPGLLARASTGQIRAAEVATECTAQIERMKRSGIVPRHLDSHQHIHAHPRLAKPIFEAAVAAGISRIRIPVEPLWLNPGNWRATMKKVGLSASAYANRSLFARRGLDRPFFGISLQGGQQFARRLFDLIPRLPSGTSELMVHPGYVDDELLALDGYTTPREQELKVLCSPAFRELLSRHAVELTSLH